MSGIDAQNVQTKYQNSTFRPSCVILNAQLCQNSLCPLTKSFQHFFHHQVI